MKALEFNSKVNLPKFCSKLGYSDYQYIKVPTFGWYAYNKDKSFIGDIFDIVQPKDREYLYALIAKKKPEYLDFDLSYSDIIESKIKYNMLEIQLWTAAYVLAKREMQTYRINYGGRRQFLKDVLMNLGMGALIENNVGVITKEVMDKFSMLPWPKKDIRGCLLIPTFCTPKHICSLEYAPWNKLTSLSTLFINGEKGWYGNIKHNKIVSNIKELATTPGITWDYKADYWFDSIVTLSDFLTVDDCIKVWTETNNTAFNKSPLKLVIEAGKLDELKNQISRLTLSQVQEAEKETGEQLIGYWKKSKEQQVQVGDQTFVRRGSCYYVYKKNSLQQVTNFAIEIINIVKRKNKFYRKGIIYFGESVTPFEIEERYFSTNHLFQKGIKDKFLTAGLGIPVVHPAFVRNALILVDSFNSDAKIITEEEHS